MKHLELEFCEAKRSGAGPRLFLLISIGIALWSALAWLNARDTHRELTERVASLQDELKRKSRQTDSPELAQRKAKLQEEEKKIQASLNYPWGRFLSIIEKVDTGKVAMLSLSHEQGQKTRITLEGVNVAALVEAVDLLNANDPGAQWYLASYQTVRQDGIETVRGEISQMKSGYQ